jgi:hypothetical protein
MQSRHSKNNEDTSGECMGLRGTSACNAVPVSEMKPYLRDHPVSRIANGLSENLKNVQKHRLLMHEEIRDILKRQGNY